ncbi:MAG: HD domain-containing phosphohydrolase, partial [Thermodesulfobacteriota bacterium]
ERKQAEEALRESEKKYRQLFESIVDVYYQTDQEGSIVMVSPSVEKLLGYVPAEVIGKKLSGFYINPEERDQFLSILGEKGEVQEFEAPLQAKDGALVFVSTNARFYRDKHGDILGVQGITRDVTKRKQAEIQLNQSLENLRQAMGGIIQVIAATVETRDPYTAGHQRRTADLARAIALEMGLPEEQQDGLGMAGIIHDLGKISIPAEILSKPGKLSQIEYQLIQGHPQVGFDVLKNIDFPWPVAEIVLKHHERFNGSGYPQGLKKEEICLGSRILMVADVVEAMSSHRPYRPALGIEAALEEIEKNKGILYDPEVVEVCLVLFREKGFSFE